MVKVRWAATDAAGKVADTAANQNLRCIPARKGRSPDAEVNPGGVWINCLQAFIVAYSFMVAADAKGIREGRREEMRFFNGRKLPRGQRGEFHIVQSVGRRVRSFVVHVRTDKAVFL